MTMISSTSLVFALLLVCCEKVDAFHTPSRTTADSVCASALFSTRTRLVSVDTTAQRDIETLYGWAGSCGVQAENGFYFESQLLDGVDDFFAATSTGMQRGSRALYVPGEMVLSSYWISQEYQGYIDGSLQILSGMNMSHLLKHFHLFVKILVEYENGDQSPYMPWLESLPRRWNTAVSMDNFCISCLPPFIKSLCQIERDQLAAFKRALSAFDYLSTETKSNLDVLRFAYNIVFTRSWRAQEGDYRIVPVADFLNHGYPDNVEIRYDENGGCEICAKEDVPPGGALTLNYGQPNNPSRFLATYGFLNDAAATYCKILINNPSQELKDIGYDPSRMVFYTEDGSIAPEVWDVLLYSRLERKPELASVKEAFYQAQMSGDEATKNAIHGNFQRETVGALLRHVNHVLSEVAELTVKMNSFDESRHPRLPLLRRHHQMVTSTFSKVKDNLVHLR